MQQKKQKLKLTLLLVSSLTIMSVITISPALPQMAIAFGNVENAAFLVKLVLTLPALMIAICSPVAGVLIDTYGRIKILQLSLILYAISGSAGYFLNNIYYILASRALLGVAVGMSMTIVITLIADYFEGMERQKFVGLQIAFMSVASILFVGLGGILSDFGWKYPFLIYLFSLVVLPLTFMFLYEPAKIEKRSLVNQDVKAPRLIWMLFINIMLMWIIFFLIPVQIPFLLKALGIQKNALVGAAIAISTGFSALSSFSYARIKNRLSFLAIFSMGYLLLAAGFLSVSVSNNYVLVIVGMILSGLGVGMIIPNTNMLVMKMAPPQIRGKEIGKLTTFWFLGQFLSPVIIFPVLNIFSLSATFMLAAAVLLMIAVTFFILHFSNLERSFA